MAAVSSALPSPRAPCFFTSIQSERGSQFSAGVSPAARDAGGPARQSATTRATVAFRCGMIGLLVAAMIQGHGHGSAGRVLRSGQAVVAAIVESGQEADRRHRAYSGS